MDTRVMPAYDVSRAEQLQKFSSTGRIIALPNVLYRKLPFRQRRGHAMDSSILKPVSELARATQVHFPNESAEYRRARQALLAEEIELRRHIERVAELRRALPPGGEVTKEYLFEDERGK